MLRGGGERRPPAHAGRLTRWERVAFALIFLLMVGYIVAATMASLHAHHHSQAPGPSRTQSAGPPP